MYHLLHHKEQKKVPGVLVLGAIIAVVFGIVTLMGDREVPVLKTQDSSVLERVDVVNLRDSTATVFWRTTEPSEGYLMYGDSPDNLLHVGYDDHDTSDNLVSRRNHVVNMSNIPSDADVYFRVIVDGKQVGQTSDRPFGFHTSRPLSSALDINPIYGEIARANGSIEEAAVVILHVGSAKPLLTRTSEDGTFLFSPCCLYDSKSGESIYPSEVEKARLEIIAEDGTSKILQSQLSAMSPLASSLIIDAEEDLFVESAKEESTPEVLAASDTVIKFKPIDIIFPRENAAIPGSRPLVKGVGEPGKTIKGKFIQENRIFRVEVDKDRNWQYVPTFDFASGGHELSIETQDVSGQPVVISRAFSILKSGEAVLGEATPSGTITPTITLAPDPTSTPSPTVILSSTPVPTPPISGFNILPIVLLSLVLIVIGGGIILLF